MTIGRAILAALALTASGALAANRGFAIKGGDRVVFLGDSITEQRLYTSYIEAYTVTRFPKQEFHFWNSGWGGDTAWLRMRSGTDEKALFAANGEVQRKLVEEAVDECLRRDVLSYKPTMVTVNYGMNDHGYQAFKEDIFRAYISSQAEIVRVLTGAGARVVLLTPQPIEKPGAHPDNDPSNQSLRKFGLGLKKIASANGAAFVNQFDPYMTVMLREHHANTNACIGGGDAIHPGPAGHTIMAAIILKALGAHALVSRAEINVSRLQEDERGIRAEKCVISNATFADGALSFDRADDCLPMPVDARAVPALKLTPVLNDLNRYELKVTGLPDDRYDLTIDGEPAATVGRKELAAGLNMATTAGPISKQALDVLALVYKKGEVGSRLWSAQIHPEKAKRIPALEAEVTDLEQQISAACQPRPHHFELKPVNAANSQ